MGMLEELEKLAYVQSTKTAMDPRIAGTLGGVVLGGGIGALSDSENRWRNGAIGATVGGALGYGGGALLHHSKQVIPAATHAKSAEPVWQEVEGFVHPQTRGMTKDYGPMHETHGGSGKAKPYWAQSDNEWHVHSTPEFQGMVTHDRVNTPIRVVPEISFDGPSELFPHVIHPDDAKALYEDAALRKHVGEVGRTSRIGDNYTTIPSNAVTPQKRKVRVMPQKDFDEHLEKNPGLFDTLFPAKQTKTSAAKGIWAIPQSRSGRKPMTIATLIRKDLDGTLHKKVASTRAFKEVLKSLPADVVEAYKANKGRISLSDIAAKHAPSGKLSNETKSYMARMGQSPNSVQSISEGRVQNFLEPMLATHLPKTRPINVADTENAARTAWSGRHLARPGEVTIPAGISGEMAAGAGSSSHVFRGNPLAEGDPNGLALMSRHPDVAAGYATGKTTWQKTPGTQQLFAYDRNHLPNQHIELASDSLRYNKGTGIFDDMAASATQAADTTAGRLKEVGRNKRIDNPSMGTLRQAGRWDPTYETVMPSTGARLMQPAGEYKVRPVRTPDMKPAYAVSDVSGAPATSMFGKTAAIGKVADRRWMKALQSGEVSPEYFVNTVVQSGGQLIPDERVRELAGHVKDIASENNRNAPNFRDVADIKERKSEVGNLHSFAGGRQSVRRDRLNDRREIDSKYHNVEDVVYDRKRTILNDHRGDPAFTEIANRPHNRPTSHFGPPPGGFGGPPSNGFGAPPPGYGHTPGGFGPPPAFNNAPMPPGVFRSAEEAAKEVVDRTPKGKGLRRFVLPALAATALAGTGAYLYHKYKSRTDEQKTASLANRIAEMSPVTQRAIIGALGGAVVGGIGGAAHGSKYPGVQSPMRSWSQALDNASDDIHFVGGLPAQDAGANASEISRLSEFKPKNVQIPGYEASLRTTGRHRMMEIIPQGRVDTIGRKAPIVVMGPRGGSEEDWIQHALKEVELHPKTAELQTTLLPHQQRVVNRMMNPDQSGLVVAHGLGSGKTLTSIAVHDALGGTASIVLPAALQENYKKEQRKHIKGEGPPADITSLQMIARNGIPPAGNLLIVDEAHRLRDSSSKGTQALRKSTADKRLLLTGSPFYNKPSDISPLINMAANQQLLPNSAADFEKKYIIEQKMKPGLWGKWIRGETPGMVQVPNPKTAPELQHIFGKYLDYEPSSTKGFPGVERRDVEVPMSKEQLKIYDTVLGKAPPWVAAKIRSGLPPSKQESSQLNAFSTGVRQVANSTAAHVVGDQLIHKPKIDMAFANLQKMMESDPRGKAVVYSNYLGAGIHPYKQLLEQSKIPHGVFTGELSKVERDEMVRQYNDDKLKVLLLSAAGGEGLDLKGTKLMQVLEPHWNEERIHQAEGRAVRYKSHDHLPEAERKVMIERYIAKRPKSGLLEHLGVSEPGGSIDEYLAKRSQEKEQLHQHFRNLMAVHK